MSEETPVSAELTTSQLSDLLGFTVSVPFLCERLGIVPVRQEKAAKYWSRAQIPEIVEKLRGYLHNYVLKSYETFVPAVKESKAKKTAEAPAPAPAEQQAAAPVEAPAAAAPAAPEVDFFGNPIVATPAAEPAPAPAVSFF